MTIDLVIGELFSVVELAVLGSLGALGVVGVVIMVLDWFKRAVK